MAQYLNIFTTAHHDYRAEYERKLAPGLCPLLRQHVPHECGWLIISYLPPSARVYSLLVCDGGNDEYHPDDFGDWYFTLNREYNIIAGKIYIFNSLSDDHVYESGLNEDLCAEVQWEEFDNLATLANKLHDYVYDTDTGKTREQTLGYIHAVLLDRIEVAAQKPMTDANRHMQRIGEAPI